MWNMFRVNKDTRTTPMASFSCLYCELWTYSTPCSSVSVVNFEQVNYGWVSSSINCCGFCPVELLLISSVYCHCVSNLVLEACFCEEKKAIKIKNVWFVCSTVSVVWNVFWIDTFSNFIIKDNHSDINFDNRDLCHFSPYESFALTE